MDKTGEKTEVTLTLRAAVNDALYMRTALGTADAPDGTRYEIALTISGGSILVSVHPPDGSERKRKQYVISVEELVSAIDRAERGTEGA